MYKQKFCFYELRSKPNDFINKSTKYLDETLSKTKEELADDLRFGKILYMYLCFPSYFSLSDYDVLMNKYAQIDVAFQKIIPQNLYTELIYTAVNNVIKYEHGINNLVKLITRFPFIEDGKFKKKLGINIFKFLYDMIDRKIEELENSLKECYDLFIIFKYGSIHDYLEINIDNLSITI
jgi:hypothetical protein